MRPAKDWAQAGQVALARVAVMRAPMRRVAVIQVTAMEAAVTRKPEIRAAAMLVVMAPAEAMGRVDRETDGLPMKVRATRLQTKPKIQLSLGIEGGGGLISDARTLS